MKRAKRDTESGRTSAVSSASAPSVAAAAPAAVKASRGRKAALLTGLAAAMLLAAGAAWWSLHRRSPGKTAAGQTTFAILPFQNLGADTSTDYLKLALPDEIATTLSYIPSLAIRPFASTRKYAKPDVDPQAAGRELAVADVLSGHFLREGDRLQVTLEVTETESNRVLWRDTLRAAASDLIGLREQITAHLRHGLFPVFTASAPETATSAPKNSEAYDLYLRATALSRDPEPNKQALGLLRRAVALDPNYAPAWNDLGKREYYDASYSDAGSAALERSRAAHERALAIDRNFTEAADNLVILRTEGGDLSGALEDAARILRARPDSARAHFTRGYVLRYAGLLEESARECDAAMAIDPKDPGWRSCSLTFDQLGNFDRALEYMRLDRGSQWATLVETNVRLQQGKTAETLALLKKLPGSNGIRVMQTCIEGRPLPQSDPTLRDMEIGLLAERDPEPNYFEASRLAYCGHTDMALRLLRRAVEGNYLAYPAMDLNPLFAKVRNSHEYASIRALAIERQKPLAARGGATVR